MKTIKDYYSLLTVNNRYLSPVDVALYESGCCTPVSYSTWKKLSTFKNMDHEVSEQDRTITGTVLKQDRKNMVQDDLFSYLYHYEHLISATPQQLVDICSKHETVDGALSYIIDHHLNQTSIDEQVTIPSGKDEEATVAHISGLLVGLSQRAH